MRHRIDGWTLWGVFTFQHPDTFDLCQDRDDLGFFHTLEDAEAAAIEYGKNPDDKYDYAYVDEDYRCEYD